MARVDHGVVRVRCHHHVIHPRTIHLAVLEAGLTWLLLLNVVVVRSRGSCCRLELVELVMIVTSQIMESVGVRGRRSSCGGSRHRSVHDSLLTLTTLQYTRFNLTM